MPDPNDIERARAARTHALEMELSREVIEAAAESASVLINELEPGPAMTSLLVAALIVCDASGLKRAEMVAAFMQLARDLPQHLAEAVRT